MRTKQTNLRRIVGGRVWGPGVRLLTRLTGVRFGGDPAFETVLRLAMVGTGLKRFRWKMLAALSVAWLIGCAGDRGEGGDGDSDVPGGPSTTDESFITSMSPTMGPWGTYVYLEGEFGADVRGFSFASGQQLSNYGTSTATEKSLRVPFPADGEVVMHTARGDVDVGTFTPTWDLVGETALESDADVLASVALATGHLATLFHSGGEYFVIEVKQGASTRHAVNLGQVQAETTRLFGRSGDLHVFALSNASPPTIVEASLSGDEFTGTDVEISVPGEFVLAGGRTGAVVWFGAGDGWYRASTLGGAWEIDAGPIVDPRSEEVEALGASADGSLYYAWPVGADILLDDMESVRVARLAPGETSFGIPYQAGRSVDDYVTELRFEDRGDGVLLHYCGSDIDPTGLTGTELRCYVGMISSGDVVDLTVGKEGAQRHAFSPSALLTFACEDDEFSLRIGPDAISEPVAWPCPLLLSAEFDPDGVPLALLSVEGEARALMPADASAYLPTDGGGGEGGALP